MKRASEAGGYVRVAPDEARQVLLNEFDIIPHKCLIPLKSLGLGLFASIGLVAVVGVAFLSLNEKKRLSELDNIYIFPRLKWSCLK